MDWIALIQLVLLIGAALGLGLWWGLWITRDLVGKERARLGDLIDFWRGEFFRVREAEDGLRGYIQERLQGPDRRLENVPARAPRLLDAKTAEVARAEVMAREKRAFAGGGIAGGFQIVRPQAPVKSK